MLDVHALFLHACLAFGNTEVFVRVCVFNIVPPLGCGRPTVYIQRSRRDVHSLSLSLPDEVLLICLLQRCVDNTAGSSHSLCIHVWALRMRAELTLYHYPGSFSCSTQRKEKKTHNRKTTKHHCCLCGFIIGFRSLSKTVSRLTKTITMRSLILLKPLMFGRLVWHWNDFQPGSRESVVYEYTVDSFETFYFSYFPYRAAVKAS